MDLDLSAESLARACKGNVANLPSFMVHDNAVWPPGVIRTDNKGRIHLRRASFLEVVVGQVPVREGLWLGPGVQEFFIDLKPHHLQGSSEPQAADAQLKVARSTARMDQHGRMPGDDGYGESLSRDHRPQDIAADVREAEKAGTRRGIRSVALDGDSE